jgi:hypothetical protein
MARDGRSEEEFQVRVRNMSERTMELGFSRAKIRHIRRRRIRRVSRRSKRKEKVEHNVSAKIARRPRREPGLS